MNTALIPVPHLEPTPAESTDLWYQRVPCGVVTQYEILSNGVWHLVELFHGAVVRCTCKIPRSCQHGKLALLLEEQYQASHMPEQAASCSGCGRMARMKRGIATCPACS